MLGTKNGSRIHEYGDGILLLSGANKSGFAFALNRFFSTTGFRLSRSKLGKPVEERGGPSSKSVRQSPTSDDRELDLEHFLIELSVDIDDFARVHDVLGVNRALELRHQCICSAIEQPHLSGPY